MRKLTLSLIAGAAALAIGGTAIAQQAPAHSPGPPMTRATAEQRSAAMFDRLDANHDGKIDQADRSLREKARFDRIDANHDGQLSYGEFTAMHDAQDGMRERQGADRGDRGEHRMAERGSMRVGRDGFRGGPGGMSRMADADKDGVITKAEFQAAALTRFDRLDANKDGTVTPDEAKAARDSMRQQWQSRRQGQQAS